MVSRESGIQAGTKASENYLRGHLGMEGPGQHVYHPEGREKLEHQGVICNSFVTTAVE